MEKIIPSPEEMRKAENQMDDNQKAQTKKRYDQYRASIQERSEFYNDHAIVNGIIMDIAWVTHHVYEPGYEIYFPQIDIDGPRVKETGVSDPILPVSNKSDIAQKIFKFAEETAKSEEDVYMLYKKVLAFAKENDPEYFEQIAMDPSKLDLDAMDDILKLPEE